MTSDEAEGELMVNVFYFTPYKELGTLTRNEYFPHHFTLHLKNGYTVLMWEETSLKQRPVKGGIFSVTVYDPNNREVCFIGEEAVPSTCRESDMHELCREVAMLPCPPQIKCLVF